MLCFLVGLERRIVPVQLVEDPDVRRCAVGVREVDKGPWLARLDGSHRLRRQNVERLFVALKQLELHDQTDSADFIHHNAATLQLTAMLRVLFDTVPWAGGTAGYRLRRAGSPVGRPPALANSVEGLPGENLPYRIKRVLVALRAERSSTTMCPRLRAGVISASSIATARLVMNTWPGPSRSAVARLAGGQTPDSHVIGFPAGSC